MDLGLKDKVVLVTGGSSGIGMGICFAFAAEGAKVAINYYRDAEKGIDLVSDAEAVAARIAEDYGTETALVPGDMSKEADVLAMFDLMDSKLGPLDILVNNAAYLPRVTSGATAGPITGYTEQEWKYTFDVNVTGVFVACREHVRRMQAEGRKGKIVNIASQAAFFGSTSGHLPYDASKGAVVSLTRALAREVAPEGINVNAVAPGMVRTEMVAKTWEAKKEKYLSRIPLYRIAEVEELANVVLFLASDMSSYMTGTTLDVTGGMMMR